MRKFVKGDRVRFTPYFLYKHKQAIPEWAVRLSAEVIELVNNDGYRVRWPVTDDDGGYKISTEQGYDLMLAKDYYLDAFAAEI